MNVNIIRCIDEHQYEMSLMETVELTFARVIADETRQEVMKLLCCVWLSVNDVVEKLDGRVNQPTVSHHLKKLEEAELVLVRQEGRNRYYTLNQEQVTVCCDSLLYTFAPDTAHQRQTNFISVEKIMTETIQIHDIVQERYSAIATGAAQSCCGTGSADCCTPVQLYNNTLTEGLPASVTDISLGCGDPVTIAGLQPGEWVLDLGSGGGIDCFMAARQVGDSGYVIGVDMTPTMLQRANENKQKLNMHNVEFRRGQIEALPVVENSMDVIMSNCVINLSPDKAAVFREAYRALKPGGRISVSDIVTEGDFSADLRADAAKWAECVTGAIDVNAYTNLMALAGFADIQVVDKADADGIVEHQAGMPRLFSARITARKPFAE
jgi:SAM-dependent methyltransferase/DNA-binding transcriptional ArsR family regulator